MHPELMFVQDVKVLYNSILSDENSLVSLKIQVLKNLQTYLQEEDSRMQEADRECEFNKSFSCVLLLRCLRLSLYVQECQSTLSMLIIILRLIKLMGFFLIQGRSNPSRRI